VRVIGADPLAAGDTVELRWTVWAGVLDQYAVAQVAPGSRGYNAWQGSVFVTSEDPRETRPLPAPRRTTRPGPPTRRAPPAHRRLGLPDRVARRPRPRTVTPRPRAVVRTQPRRTPCSHAGGHGDRDRSVRPSAPQFPSKGILDVVRHLRGQRHGADSARAGLGPGPRVRRPGPLTQHRAPGGARARGGRRGDPGAPTAVLPPLALGRPVRLPVGAVGGGRRPGRCTGRLLYGAGGQPAGVRLLAHRQRLSRLWAPARRVCA